VADVSADDVNRWRLHLENSRRAPHTIKGKRANLKTLLNSGLDAIGLSPLSKIRGVKVPRKNPNAFSPTDIATLIVAAQTLKKFCPITGIRRSDWWMAFVMTAWDTAIRLGDLLRLGFSDVNAETLVVTITQHKTGIVHTCQLRPETWQAISVIARQGDKPRELIFPWAATRYQFYVGFRQICGLAGLQGTSKYLRRGRATQEAKAGGPAAAACVLGHSDRTGTLAQAHYIDRAQLNSMAPLAPALPLPHAVLKRLPALEHFQAAGVNGHNGAAL
jgi:integrase